MSNARFAAIVGTLMLVELLSSMETSMVVAALPTIARQFHDLTGTGWLMAGFALVQAASAAIMGRFGDLFGRKRVLVIVTVLCLVGSLISATSDSLTGVIAGRCLQGASGAILPLAYGIIRQIVAAPKVPFWVGCLTGVYVVGTGGGFIAGGFLTELGNWPLLFHITAAYAAAVLLPLIFIVPESTPAVSGWASVDLLGGALFAPAVALALYGMTAQPGLFGASWLPISCTVAGLALLAIWFSYEWRHADPLIDVRLLVKPPIAVANACYALVGLSLAQAPVLLMFLIQQPRWTGVGMGLGAGIAGLIKLPSNGASTAVSPVAGWACGRYSGRTVATAGALIGTGALLFLTFYHQQLWQAVLASIVSTVSTTILLVAVPNMIIETAPEERVSEATGLAVVTKGIFAAIGTQIMTALLAWHQVGDSSGTHFPSSDAYGKAIGFMCLCTMAMAVITYLGRYWMQRGARELSLAADR